MKIIKQKFRKRIKPNEQREITKVGRAYERRKGKNHESCCIENNEWQTGKYGSLANGIKQEKSNRKVLEHKLLCFPVPPPYQRP